MDALLQQHLPQIQQLMRQYGVQRAYLFGSAAKGTLKENSDVDFLIKFPDDMHYETYYNNYVGLMHALESLLKRDIELVAEETLQNPYLIRSIDSHKLQVL